MLPLYLLFGYVLGSAGLYLAVPSFRRDLHDRGSGNTTVLHGLQVGNPYLAGLNLLIEAAKPALLVWSAGAVFGVETNPLQLLGVLAAVLGRMFPLFTGGRHGGKGSVTYTVGLTAMYPHLVWVAVAFTVFGIGLSKLLPRHYRTVMHGVFLITPFWICLLTGWDIFPVLAALTWGMWGYGFLRPEDGDQGFRRLRNSEKAIDE
jgi:glycerol-3-phosphate acyltransferase PlsY